MLFEGKKSIEAFFLGAAFGWAGIILLDAFSMILRGESGVVSKPTKEDTVFGVGLDRFK